MQHKQANHARFLGRSEYSHNGLINFERDKYIFTPQHRRQGKRAPPPCSMNSNNHTEIFRKKETESLLNMYKLSQPKQSTECQLCH